MAEMTEGGASPDQTTGGRGKLGCALIAFVGLVVIAAAVAGYLFLAPLFQKPSDVVREFAEAITRDDMAAARAVLCSDLKDKYTDESLRTYIKEGLKDVGTASLQEIDEFPYPRSEGRVGIYFRMRGSIGSRRVQAYLLREERRWRICEIDWGGSR